MSSPMGELTLVSYASALVQDDFWKGWRWLSGVSSPMGGLTLVCYSSLCFCTDEYFNMVIGRD